jgi:hypothetical protein
VFIAKDLKDSMNNLLILMNGQKYNLKLKLKLGRHQFLWSKPFQPINACVLLLPIY